MNLKTLRRAVYIFFTVCLLTVSQIFGQPNNPPPEDPDTVPISGLGILLGTGALLGVKRLLGKKKEQNSV